MNKYISWKDLWSILQGVEYEGADSEIALVNLVEMLRNAHGGYDLRDNKIIFIEQYDYTDYKWSSSVISSDDPQMRIQKKEELVQKINEEKECIQWLLEHLNERFYDRDEMYLKVFFERYFLDKNVSSTMKKLNLNNRSFYVAMKNAEYLAKRGWLLLTPPKALTDLLFYGSIEHCKKFHKS